MQHRSLATLVVLVLLLPLAMAGDAPAATTVIVVRHTEKAVLPDEPDPPLSEPGRRRAEALRHALSSTHVDAVYSSPFHRTRDTARPVATERGLEIREVDPRDATGLAARLLAAHAGETVLVTGHSNTVPELIRALGVETDLVLDERHDYDDLFVVTVGPEGGARLLHLHYGKPSGP